MHRFQALDARRTAAVLLRSRMQHGLPADPFAQVHVVPAAMFRRVLGIVKVGRGGAFLLMFGGLLLAGGRSAAAAWSARCCAAAASVVSKSQHVQLSGPRANFTATRPGCLFAAHRARWGTTIMCLPLLPSLAGALQAGPDRHAGAGGLPHWRPQLPNW